MRLRITGTSLDGLIEDGLIEIVDASSAVRGIAQQKPVQVEVLRLGIGGLAARQTCLLLGTSPWH